MANLETDTNRYLFYEFGVGGSKRAVSETWPFKLRRLSTVGNLVVFEFDDDEPYSAFGGNETFFMPKAGMTIGDLKKQMAGADWISRHNPVSLDMSLPSDDSVP